MSEPAGLERTPLHELHREPRRADGAVRRLRDAGPVSVRDHQGARAHARRGRAVRRLPHGPGAALGSRRRGGARVARPGRRRRSGGEPPALRAVHERARRNPRRPDGRELRRSPRPRRQRRRQGTGPPAPAGASRGPLHDRAARRARAARAARSAGGSGDGAARSGRGAHGLHDRRPDRDRRRALLRQPVGLYRRGRIRDLGRRPSRRSRLHGGCSRSRRSRPSAWARATRCVSRPACACTATTSTPRPRRSKPISPGRSPKRGAPMARAPAAIPARR